MLNKLQKFGFVVFGALTLGSGCGEKPVDSSAIAATASWVIEPHAGVGKIRAGMKSQDVISAVGEPQRRTANALEYTALGFAVMTDPEGTVSVVMCGDVMGIRNVRRSAFQGRTKEGVGLLTSKTDLIRILGDPSRNDQRPTGIESMRYDSLGITFALEQGQVYHMIIRLDGDSQPGQAITIDLGTNPPRQ
jgi:hypothetical protein